MVFTTDRPTGQRCPYCKNEVIYNGNYFCSFAFCNWTLAEDDDVVPYLTGLRDKALEQGDIKYAERCNMYLENYT